MIRFTYDEIAISWVLSIIILVPLGYFINKKLQKQLDKQKSDYVSSKEEAKHE